jgi:hypothetical protein
VAALGALTWLVACGSRGSDTDHTGGDDVPELTALQPEGENGAGTGGGPTSGGRGGQLAPSESAALDDEAGGAMGDLHEGPAARSPGGSGGEGAVSLAAAGGGGVPEPGTAGTSAVGGSASSGGDDGSLGGAGDGSAGNGGTAANAGEGSGAAGAWSGGAGGQSPVEVPTSTNCTSGTLEGTIAPAEAPVVVEARLTSDDSADLSGIQIAPTSAVDTLYLASHFGNRLVQISPDGVKVQPTGLCGELQRLVVDDGDRPELFLTTRNVSSNGGSDIYFALWTPADAGWVSDFIVQGGVDGGGYGSAFGNRGSEGFLDHDGQPHALVYDPEPGLSIYDRSALDSWTSVAAIDDTSHEGAVLVDSLDRTRLVYFNSYGQKYQFTEWTDGTQIPGFRKDGVSTDVAIAAGLSGILGVARVTEDGIAVSFSDGTTVSDDQLVPNTQPLSAQPCYEDHSVCEPLTCESDGLFPSSVALASTSDGSFWLSYAYVHEQSEYAAEGSSTQSCWTLSSRTRTLDVVLVELSAGGAASPSVRWSHPNIADSLTRPALAARGSRLVLAASDLLVARVFVIDEEQL